jgi:hypothetical protein
VKSSRALIVLALAFVVALVIAVAVALALIPGYVAREAVQRARERGIELELGELDYGWQWATISNAKARLVEVDGITLRIEKLSVDLDGTDVRRLDFDGLAVEADGSLPSLALAVGAWSKRFPNAYSLPLSAKRVSVAWRPDPGKPPWLEIADATIATSPAGTVVVAEHTKIAGAVDIGRSGTVWSSTQTSVALGLGETELELAPVKLNADLSGASPKLTLELAPTPLERLAGPFAMALPVQGVTGSGQVTLEFAGREAALPEKGSARLSLDGWIPPHPAELDGFVFGKTTIVETDLGFAPDGKRIDLTGTRVTAGKFVLSGGGMLVPEDGALGVSLDLRGALPCDALAAAATESRLGRLLGREMGKKGGQAARRVVGGSVSVRVLVEGSTRDVAGAKVTRSIGVGCGLKPLTLEDLAKLGESLLPSELSRLPEELERITGMPKGTLALPSALPTLPLPSGLTPPGLPPLPSSLRFPLPPARSSRFAEGDAGTAPSPAAGAE